MKCSEFIFVLADRREHTKDWSSPNRLFHFDLGQGVKLTSFSSPPSTGPVLSGFSIWLESVRGVEVKYMTQDANEDVTISFHRLAEKIGNTPSFLASEKLQLLGGLEIVIQVYKRSLDREG